MKKSIYLLFFLILLNIHCFTQNFSSANYFSVKMVSLTTWNSDNGILYSKVPGANLGATSFEVLANNMIAFLCNSSNEIVIVDAINGKAFTRIPIGHTPRDFCYDDGYFYVLGEYDLSIISIEGSVVNNIKFNKSFLGVERIARFNNSTYLLLPSGNSLMIESDGKSILTNEIEGWICATGVRIKTSLNANSGYNLTFYTEAGEKFENSYQTESKVAGVYFVGSSDGKIILDVQLFISENPINIERKILSIPISDMGLGKPLGEITIPNVYYVLSNRDFLLSLNGILYNMITAPEGVFIFTLSESIFGDDVIHQYPESLINNPYHFNYHLLNNNEY